MQNTGHDEHTVGTEDLKQNNSVRVRLKNNLGCFASLHYNYFKEGQYLKQNKNKKPQWRYVEITQYILKLTFCFSLSSSKSK